MPIARCALPTPLQPLALAAKRLQHLPAAGSDSPAMVVVRQGLAPGQMGSSQQPLLAGLLALLHPLLAEDIKKLDGAPARRTERCAQSSVSACAARLCQWERIHASRSCRSRIGRAASAALSRRMEDKEVVIALQVVLKNALR